jgi:heme/copper-type cytochrome/quinol oxidase subunit 3
MAELHPIVLHFPVASLALSVFTTIVAIIFTIMEKLDFFNRNRVKKFTRGKELITQQSCRQFATQYESISFFLLIVGLAILPITGLAGFLDASGNIGISNVNLDNLAQGVANAARSEVISYKVIWAIIGTALFLYAAIIRIYFVNYRKVRFYDQPILYWFIYAISQIVGYLVLTLVAGAGAIIVYEGTLIQDIPIFSSFLPGGHGDFLPVLLIVALILVFLTIMAGFSRKPKEIKPPNNLIDEQHEEHEVTLWPAALAFGTLFVAFAILQFTEGKELAAIGFLWIFFVVLLGFIFNEAYTQKLFKKPREGWVWLFLGSEVILFSMIIGTSLGLRVASGTNWPNPSDVLNIPLTAINTFVLIISSFTMVKSVEAIQQDKPKQLRNYLLATFGLGSIFLTIQVSEYLELLHVGFTPTTNLFGSTFYIQTGLHGAHVFFGVLLVLFTTLRAHQGGFTKENHGGVELVGLYWHFVDLVWIILFTLVYLI